MEGTQGKVWKFGNDVDTDQILSSQYLLLPTISEMTEYAFESMRPEFAANFRQGDIILAGNNFGCGSSREQSPRILKELGVSVIIARSYARIFFRNCINIGLPLIICDQIYDVCDDQDNLTFFLERGLITLGERNFKFERFPEHMLKIMEDGGLIEHINKLGNKL